MAAAGAFGRELRKCRTIAIKTLKEVAEFLNVSIPYVSDVELGRRQPLSSRDISRLAVFLKCDEAQTQRLYVSAIQDRGEITLSPKSGKARELLVALDRRMNSLDDETLRRIKEILGDD